jgi:hypothetical protein
MTLGVIAACPLLTLGTGTEKPVLTGKGGFKESGARAAATSAATSAGRLHSTLGRSVAGCLHRSSCFPARPGQSAPNSQPRYGGSGQQKTGFLGRGVRESRQLCR